MASVRKAAECLLAPENFSVLRHVFGFQRRRVPADPAATSNAAWERSEVSLLDRVRRLNDEPHHRLNVIKVGWDQFDDTTTPTFAQMEERADYAVYRSHEIYGQVNVSIGRVLFGWITEEEADGLDVVATNADLDRLTDEWNMGGDGKESGIDIFVPFSMTIGGGLLGRSEIDGPCKKEYDEDVLDASVINPLGANNNAGNNGLEFARTFAHENGHYLGLRHPSPQASFPFRLMTQSGTAYANGGNRRGSVNLTSAEGTNVSDHCSMHEECAS